MRSSRRGRRRLSGISLALGISAAAGSERGALGRIFFRRRQLNRCRCVRWPPAPQAAGSLRRARLGPLRRPAAGADLGHALDQRAPLFAARRPPRLTRRLRRPPPMRRISPMKCAAWRASRSCVAASSARSLAMVAVCWSACAWAEPSRAFSAMLAVLQPAGLAVLLLEGGQRRLQPGDLAGLVLRARLERPDLALEGDACWRRPARPRRAPSRSPPPPRKCRARARSASPSARRRARGLPARPARSRGPAAAAAGRSAWPARSSCCAAPRSPSAAPPRRRRRRWRPAGRVRRGS